MYRFARLADSPLAASKNRAALFGGLMLGGLIGWLTVAGAAWGQSNVVFMAADIAFGGPSKLMRFDAGTQTFAVDAGGPDSYMSGVTVHNNEVLVANQTAGAIQRFAPDGTYLGQFAASPDPNSTPTNLESDSSGSVYTTFFPFSGSSIARRYNSAGQSTLSINFGTTRQLAGIDADASGNIYIAETTNNQLYKETANGAYVNQISLGSTPFDLAIDEVGKRLYLATGTASIKIFDISAAAPSLVGSITTPDKSEIVGIDFAAESGNILATDVGGANFGSKDPRGLEYSPAGVLLREYRPTTAIAAYDIVTLPVVASDYNRNGVWDAADYIVWRKGDPAADGTGDGHVDNADYQFWRELFGQSSYVPAATAAQSPAELNYSVPEPTAILLLTSGAIFVIQGRNALKRSRGIWALFCVIALFANQSAHAQYNFTTINYPGAVSTEVNNIDNTGRIVGSYEDSGGHTHAYALENGAFTSFDVPDSLGTTSANGSNSSGQVVGWYLGYQTIPPYQQTIRTYIRTGSSYFEVGGGLHSSPLIATLEAKAYAINDAGSVVGYYTQPSTGYYQAFLYNGGFTSIGSQSQAIGINNANAVVGYSYNGKPHGFLYISGNLTIIDYPLIGARGTVAQGINDSGQIAGIYFDASDRDRGFVKTGASYVTIDYPGSIYSGLSGINNAGQVVGYYQDAGGSHGFLATPTPEPSTLVLAAMGLLGFIGKRRRVHSLSPVPTFRSCRIFTLSAK